MKELYEALSRGVNRPNLLHPSAEFAISLAQVSTHLPGAPYGVHRLVPMFVLVARRFFCCRDVCFRIMVSQLAIL